MRDRATAILSTIVVDDEQLACDELSFLLKDFPEIEIIATGSNGLEAVEIIQQLEPELVFLDVNMPGLDGMGVVRRLRENGAVLPHFIFVTLSTIVVDDEQLACDELSFLLKDFPEIEIIATGSNGDN